MSVMRLRAALLLSVFTCTVAARQRALIVEMLRGFAVGAI
jgi:hypothetical protein